MTNVKPEVAMLKGLAKAYEGMGSIRRRLLSERDVIETSMVCAVRSVSEADGNHLAFGQHRDGGALWECYVEAYSADSLALSFGLDVLWFEEWVVRAQVMAQTYGGQEFSGRTLDIELPRFAAPTLEESLGSLDAALDLLEANYRGGFELLERLRSRPV